MTKRILPVIMSGGSGTRLWPLSRPNCPKQFHSLTGPETLLQQTAMRVSDRSRFDPPLVISSVEHRFVVAEQLRAAGVLDATIILEPFGRNTGPAAVLSALSASRINPDNLVLLMPADHLISDLGAFHTAVQMGEDAAAAGKIVLFGIQPTSPETGYGYIRPQPSEGLGAARGIAQFVEKPDHLRAQEYCRNGFLWNSGIFLFSPSALLGEFERFEPELLQQSRAAFAKAVKDADFVRIKPELFEPVRSISIDKAVMERTTLGVVVSTNMEWTDVGTWGALWQISPKDDELNYTYGDVHLKDVTGSYVRSEGPAIVAVGLQDVLIVALPDAVLVSSRSAQQSIATIVADLQRKGHPTAGT